MGLSKLLRSASARPTSLDCQSAWLHYCTVLTAKDLKFGFHTSALPLTAKDLMFRFRISALPWLPKIWSSALSFCIDCQKCEVQCPHFHSAFTAKYVKFCSRGYALLWLAKAWSSAFRTCSARTSKDVKFRFRISSLPGLPKICSFASALSLSLDCQRPEDRLLH